jgi:iron complex outermembrane receptor protein
MPIKLVWKLSLGVALTALMSTPTWAAGPSGQQPSGDDSNNPDIIVTAQRKTENLRDVPIPVTVLSGQDLGRSNQLRLQDYYTSVPGLSVVAGSSASTFQFVSIRGIISGYGANPTVGFTVDDVPYGSATGAGGGNVVPDIDPGDLARVEVLRGPQGTLYGASSMGGLIKYVTVDPSTDRFSGRVEAGVNGVDNGGGAGYNFRGSVNVPISDTLAIRASGFTRKDPGYIDNPVLGTKAVNDQRVSGGRVSALWRPSDAVSLKLSALYQDFKADGVNDVTPGLGDLQQNYVRGVGDSGGNIQAYSGTLTAKLGPIDVTSLTGYNVRKNHITIDETAFFGGLTQTLYGVGNAGLTNNNNTKRFTQELRFSGKIGDRIDWLLGGIYSHEKSVGVQSIPAIDAATGNVVAVGYEGSLPSTYKEFAAFGDLTVHITDRLDVQFGLRQSKINLSQKLTVVQPLFTGGSTVPTIGATERSDAHPLTYLVTPRFKVSDDLMVYARLASGYRPGGPNSNFCTSFNFPCQFGADKTREYEVGLKGSFADHKLTIDAAAYYIDWSGIQLQAQDSVSGFNYTTNASHAKSQGVELSVQAKPWTGMTIGASGAFNDAVLTKDIPSAQYGLSGDRLPFSSRFSGSLSAEQRFPLGAGVTGNFGGMLSYVGDRKGIFMATAAAPRQDLPEYIRTDFHVGAEYDDWTVNVFLNNAFNKRGVLDGPLETFPRAYIYIQPRTFGLNISKQF